MNKVLGFTREDGDFEVLASFNNSANYLQEDKFARFIDMQTAILESLYSVTIEYRDIDLIDIIEA